MPCRQLNRGDIWAGEVSLGVDNLYMIFTEETTYICVCVEVGRWVKQVNREFSLTTQRTCSFKSFGCKMPGKKKEPLSSTVFKSKIICYETALVRLGPGAGCEEAQGTTGEMPKIRLLSVALDSLTHPQ